MSDDSTDYGAQLAGGVLEVASQFVNQNVVKSIRKNFTGDGKRERGDFYMDQSRELLRTHLPTMDCNDKRNILYMLTSVRKARVILDDVNTSRVRRFLSAMNYKRLSKKTYEIVVQASNRAVDNDLMLQIVDDIGDPLAQSIFDNLQSTHTNPFTESYEAVSMLNEVGTSNLSQVEVETYQSEATGAGAIFLELHRPDASTQNILATFSPPDLSDNSADTVDIHNMVSGPQAKRHTL